MFLLVGAFSVLAWYQSKQERPLARFELSLAEGLAGSWELGEGVSERSAISVFERLSDKCGESLIFAATRKLRKELSENEIAKVSGQQVDKKQECLNRSHSYKRIFSVNPNIDYATREEVLSWWPYPLLENPNSGISSAPEYFVAHQDGGLKGSAIRGLRGVIAAYAPASAHPLISTFDEVLAAGGLWLSIEPAGADRHVRDKLGSEIQVRGGKGRVLTVAIDDASFPGSVKGQVDRLFLSFLELQPGAPELRVEVVASSNKFSQAAVVEFVSALAPVDRP